ncbi:MAG: bifunctional enoyl-CoA hydratase/phosphate acetyltransferase, partial [Xanthobacteraceae bacterium]|nr:bifunctional enoyl-CoA hydratase/phosphate acetyltransferase [Xanthobacteraceae bacterium]
MQYIENKTFDELNIGDRAELTRTLRKEDVELFAVMSGDVNPAHVDEAFAKTDQFHKVIAHGMWGGALISAVLGTELPGPGTIYLNQSLSFRRPVGLGDTVTVRVTVREKLPEKKRLLLDCECINQSGETVIKGEANVIAPSEKVRRPRALLPEVHLHERGLRYRQLVEEARKSSPIRTAVVYPCDGASLSWALDCASEKLIIPVLVGPEEELRRIADEAYRDLHGIEIVGAASSLAAADRAVALAREGRVDALLRGALPTQELMGAVMKPLIGLRTERRMSHVLALDVPNYSKPLFVTDAAINGHPDLPTKRDIVRNAIELTHALGIAEPKVAILSAIETVVPKLASRIDAAALRKMSEWGQITGALVDGPLA